MNVITPEYRELNTQLHETRKDFGVGGAGWAAAVRAMCVRYHAWDVLDYGCGKGSLAQAMDFPIHCYDPAIAEFAAEPVPADLVVCTDVLEHIEPECLDTVIADLRRVTKRAIFCNISTVPAVKTLADGRNAHLIVEPAVWWLAQLNPFFMMKEIYGTDTHLVLLLEPRDGT